ncbi:hypothetical protein F0919_15870 [Taibaiella lutea]|uniref:Uncharacterized protein n=1 Tax=Taibaiella lutea TaxID=2608001 RepID=A0A5M6CBA8_9BACT|nr:hypothetical protein [Taibaiella lutea]KAA5532273.1 hypothetical protein F0919_15870 [Taibaiella lutea]
MRKKVISTAIILSIIGCLLIFSWTMILVDNYVIRWRNVTGLILFIPLPILIIKKYSLVVLATGIYLLLGSFRLLSLVPGVWESSVSVGKFEISGFDWLSLVLLILYFILHIDILINIELDYKERRAKMRNDVK